MDQKKIDRINQLARKAKEEELSQAEKDEQQVLRKEYIEAYKGSLKAHLSSISVMDEKGNKTKLKPKKI